MDVDRTAGQWTAADFAGFYPKPKAPQPTAGSNSYDSTITDFDAERAAAEIKQYGQDDVWSALQALLKERAVGSAGEEAAAKLISNHTAVLHDVTNPAPTTQRDLIRVQPSNAPYVDQVLVEVARRLLRRRKNAKILSNMRMDASNLEQVSAWSNTATYLCGRIQGRPEERPGRAPDMSSQAADEMRGVLQEIWWEAYEVLRQRPRIR